MSTDPDVITSATPAIAAAAAAATANKVLHNLGLAKGPSKLAPSHTRKTTATGSSACGTYTWTMSAPKTSPAAAGAAPQPVSTLGKPQESRVHQQQHARQQQQQQQQRQGLVGQKRSSVSAASSSMRPGAGLLDTPVALGRSAAAAVGPVGGAGPSRTTGLPTSSQQGGCKGSAAQVHGKGPGGLHSLLDRPVSLGGKR
jgi:hypothetical protein